MKRFTALIGDPGFQIIWSNANLAPVIVLFYDFQK